MSNKITLYIDRDKDYKKILQKYYISPGNPKVGSGYSKDWLYGYVACLNASLMINDAKRYKLNCFIKELKEEQNEFRKKR